MNQAKRSKPLRHQNRVTSPESKPATVPSSKDLHKDNEIRTGTQRQTNNDVISPK